MNKSCSTTEEPVQTYLLRELGRRVKLPASLASLRQKLSRKAKQEPKFRFYVLYDRIYRTDTLETAWRLVRANGGGPGVDGVTIRMIEESEGGPEALIRQLQEELRTKRYRPLPVLRKYIPKVTGKKRPLGVPAVRDRVVQTATLLILEPIFEADFEDCSYGFRPERSAHDALEAIRNYLKAGYTAVYDADLQAYFDSIPHDKLMACVRMRVVDGSVLKLIRMWLTAQVVEEGKKPCKRPRRGTPQGGVISPLLANIYLHWFDTVFYRKGGPAHWAKAKLVRYADDFVVLARFQGERLVGWVEATLETWLGLRVNREKTRIVNLKEQGASFDFLGFTFRYDRDRHGRGHRYLNVFPSAKAVAREREVIRQKTNARQCYKPVTEVVQELNQHLAGWANYYAYGYSRKAFREINWIVGCRLAVHLRRRSQRRYRPPGGVSLYKHLHDLGLIYL